MSLRRPVVRYHGGKWKLAPWIISHFPEHRVYVEPFGGAASVLIRKPKVYAEIYNDLDSEIVNLFAVLRDVEKSARLVQMLELTPFARDEFVQAYQPTEDPIERARRTVVKGYMGFGSAAVTQDSPTAAGGGWRSSVPTGFRANSNRSGTTPAKDWSNFPPCLAAICERVRGVVIENRDATEVMNQHDSEDTLHYVDPPYVHSTRGQRQWRYCKSYRHEMNEEQHEALIEFLGTLKGAVVLSGYRCDLYDSRLTKWQRIDRDAHADGARDRVESLWLNPAASFQHGFQFEVPA